MKIVLIIIAVIIVLVICAVVAFLMVVVPAVNHAVEMAEKHPPMENTVPSPDTVPGMEKYDYFCSDGGPFILISSEIKKRWKGATLINLALKKGDYWKACQVVSDEGSHGTINAYDHQIFVVDAPMLATHKELNGDTFFIYALVAWGDEDLDGLIDLAVNETKESDFVSAEERVECGDDGFVFMYAGDIYDNCVYGYKDMTPKPGTYNISEAHWKNELNEVRIFKFSLEP